MKKLLLIITSVYILSGCSKVLDIDDLGYYSADQVWNDENLANAYMANIYNVFGNWNTGADRTSDQLSGILFFNDAITITNGNFANWNYTNMRLINQAIKDVETGSLADNVKANIKAQALVLRAYVYFGMVRAHGGVPYITIPQDRYADSLDVPRNSTKECFELMVKDLDDAIPALPNIASSSSNWGKIDASFAKAFKAKVLLYKASPQFNPTNPWGNTYWQEAYTANKTAYDDLKAAGYRLIDDYSGIALTAKNAEIVFPVINSFPAKVASWDFGVRPGSLSRGPASACPTWEMIKAFPMKDGKAFSDPTSAYYKTEAQLLQRYWQDRDPRFGKSIVWNAKTYPVAGTPTGYKQYTTVGIADALDNYGVNPNVGDRSTNNNTYTGFFILKNSKLDLTQAQVQQYDVDFVLMRFAEVMLNYAEAANETGRTADALTILREIRKRAGIEAGTGDTYGIAATTREQVRQAIMDERNIELSFEGHRYNDLRRWRKFDVLNNGTKHGVEAIAIKTDGTEMPLTEARPLATNYTLTEENFKYVVRQVPEAGEKINILPEKYYFYPIPQSIIGKTKKLEQNIDWGGTFDPTIH